MEVAPWRLALVVVMQYIEGLTDRQAADAVRRCMDWKYALSLDLHDPGFDFTLLHDFRDRLLAHDAGQRLLDTFLATCKARGWIKARGTQRTDSTHVLAAIRTLHRLECVLEAMHYALNQLSAADPAWVQQQVSLEWYTRYGLRSDQSRLPKEASKREALACQIGADGYQLLEWVGPPRARHSSVSSPPWRRSGRFGCNTITAVPSQGWKTLRWRTTDEQPPSALRIQSPYDLDARYCRKRDTHWVGYKLHLTETCEPGQPDLITQVLTTPATTPDWSMGRPIEQDLAPVICCRGRTYSTVAMWMRTSWSPPSSSIRSMWWGRPLGPIAGNIRPDTAMTYRPSCWIGTPSRPTVPKGIPVSNGGQATMSRAIRSCASGLTGPPVAPVPPAVCTSAQDAPRQLTVRPQAHHEALQAARQRQETPEFKAQYALRAGVESSLSQGIRRFDLRQSRYIGLARTHLQQLLTATAMNVVRVIAWLWGEPLGERRRKPGHFARLAPHPLSRQAVKPRHQ